MTPEESAAFFADHLATRVMVILRGAGERTVALCERAWSAGVDLVEIPVQSAGDLVALAAAVERGAAFGKLVGAGTVVTPDLAVRVADAGAAFTVAPGTDTDVVATSLARGLPHLPGVATPTEISAALRLGLVWQKFFPAAVLGTDWVRAVRAPFPSVRFVATGGISVGNARQFVDAGCGAVSLGSAFADAPLPEVRALLAEFDTRSGSVPG